MSGGSIAAIGVKNPSLIMKALLPVIFAGILVVYGMVVSIFISTNSKLLLLYCLVKASEPYSLFTAAMHLGAGLCVGMACLFSGYAIGRLGDEGVRSFGKQPRFYIGLMLMMIFSEILAIYGLIVAFMIQMKGKNVPC